MRIKKVHIKNFRSFQNCEVEFGNFTSLIGANGAGKSTVLYALNIFFRETDSATTNLIELDEEDFHNRNTKEPIEITVTFGDLSQQALETFSEYARQGLLIVTAQATFNEQGRIATVHQFGQRLGMEKFKKFFQMYGDGASAQALKDEYESLRNDFPDLPKAGAKDANRDALRAYEAARPDQCILIPSEDQFYGFSRGSNRLAKFIQWVYLPAVKDATREQVEAKNTALGKILARTVRARVKFEDDIERLREETLDKYRKILESQQEALEDISQSLSGRLQQWAHPDATARLEWKEDTKKSVQVEEPSARLLAGEGTFEGDLARFGHGLQRSYLLALLQELANADDENAPRLILACEEPELYQHPPQARHLANVLQDLSERNSQVMVSTHSPYFVTGKHFESVRLVRRNLATKCSDISSISSNSVSSRIAQVTGEPQVPHNAQIALLHQVLQPSLSEIFFTPRLILVEGLEDMAFITSWIILTNQWEAYRRGGCHIVPVGGKSYLIETIIMVQALEIPFFVIFDGDGDKQTKPNERPSHERDNKALLRLLGGDDTDYFPNTSVWGDNYVIWPINIAKTLKPEVETTIWDRTYTNATKGLGSPYRDYSKNIVHIGEHLRLLKNEGVASIPSLDKLCNAIISFSAK